MGTKNLFFPQTHFDLIDKGVLYEFFCKNMLWVFGSFLVLVCSCLFYVFGSVIRYFLRYRVNDQIGSNSGETASAVITSKYEFLSGNDISGFVEEPETVSFTVQKFHLDSNDSRTVSENPIIDAEVAADRDKAFGTINDEVECYDQGKEEDFVDSSRIEKVLEKQDQLLSENEFLGNRDSSDEAQSILEDYSLIFDSKAKSDSINLKFMFDRYVGEAREPESVVSNYAEKGENIEEISNLEAISLIDESVLEQEEDVLSDQNYDFGDEYIELDPRLQESIVSSEEDLLQEVEETMPRETPSVSSFDDQDDLEFSLEHEDLVKQLKMELRNARTGGLPTILEEEESESPKIEGDLKPLKMDEKLEHKDRMDEIQKVYKTYAEKMRKLDILNFQTMHAIGFLQLKDPSQINITHESSAPAIKFLSSENLWLSKPRRSPTMKFIGELQKNLELVYVGHVCLSWEILHWQYGKAQQLGGYDSQGFRHYNRVASEFQLFQVLLQRFMENESFQGPRVQNYVKNKCVFRSFLLVPAIKDDCLKDKKGRRNEEEDAISISVLTEIIKESMRSFWEFLRGDKDEANVILKGRHQTQVDLQDPTDSELLINIRTDFQKKEKKLKDILRSGNCIVKKFQKHQENQLNHALLFAQVELKLVSRVLNMSRLTTNQLLWCREKLDKIYFVNRKIHRDPSFLLFPC